MADGNLLKSFLVNDTSCVGFLALKRSYCSFNIFFLHIYMITHAESGLSLIESVFLFYFLSRMSARFVTTNLLFVVYTIKIDK